MQYITKLKLAAIHQLCDAEDESTEYMYRLMQNKCKVDLDCINSYFMLGKEEHGKLFLELNDLLKLIQKL